MLKRTQWRALRHLLTASSNSKVTVRDFDLFDARLVDMDFDYIHHQGVTYLDGYIEVRPFCDDLTMNLSGICSKEQIKQKFETILQRFNPQLHVQTIQNTTPQGSCYFISFTINSIYMIEYVHELKLPKSTKKNKK